MAGLPWPCPTLKRSIETGLLIGPVASRRGNERLQVPLPVPLHGRNEMSLLDVLTGMRNGPRGAGGGGGMSPITMALLGLLAYKAVKGLGAGRAKAGSGMAATGGGLGDLLKGGLGSAGAGGLGSILTGGLGDLLKQFQGAGKGDVAQSWMGTGENKPIAPADLSKVLTAEQLDFLSDRTGLSHEELLAGLAEQLPRTVDELTPQGRLPSPDEVDQATSSRGVV